MFEVCSLYSPITDCRLMLIFHTNLYYIIQMYLWFELVILNWWVRIMVIFSGKEKTF